MVVALEVMAVVIVAVAAWLLRTYRHQGVQDVAISKLVSDATGHALIFPRMQRVELVVGIDPVAGGGLAAQIEQVHTDVKSSAKERREQNVETLREMRLLTVAIVTSSKDLSDRIQALELTAVRR